MPTLQERMAAMEASSRAAEKAAIETRDLVKEALSEQKDQGERIAKLEDAQKWTQRVGAAILSALAMLHLTK